jgi:hypothetical protein
MPRLTSTPDATTGEYEVLEPIVADGVTRQFYVSGGNLYAKVGSAAAEVLATNITTTDPDPASSTYNQTYKPFTASNVASTSGVKMFLIAKKSVHLRTEFVRMSTTIKLRNIQ